jgi:hypothetical protein
MVSAIGNLNGSVNRLLRNRNGSNAGQFGTLSSALGINGFLSVLGQSTFGPRNSGRRKALSGFKNLVGGRFKRGIARLRSGGRQIGKKLGGRIGKAFGGPKGAAMGADIGEALGGRAAIAGGVVAAGAAFTYALIEAGKALRGWTNTVVDENFKFAANSPSMSIVMAQTNIREMFRERRKGEALAGSASQTANAQQNMEDSLEKFDVEWQQFKNWGARQIAGGIETIAGGKDNENETGGQIGGIIGAIGGSVLGLGGMVGGGLGGAWLGSKAEEGGRQATDWLGKQTKGTDSDYYKRQSNSAEIQEELKQAIADGNKEAEKKLTDILTELKKANESNDYDLSGWIMQAAKVGNAFKKGSDIRLDRMRQGFGNRMKPAQSEDDGDF